MKSFTTAAIIAITAAMSFNAIAQSNVSGGTTIRNNSTNTANRTTAIGKDSMATTGSVNLKDADVLRSKITNTSTNVRNTTTAVGKDSLASTGSISIKDSKITKSTLVNHSTNKGNNTVARGTGSTASTGSITVE